MRDYRLPYWIGLYRDKDLVLTGILSVPRNPQQAYNFEDLHCIKPNSSLEFESAYDICDVATKLWITFHHLEDQGRTEVDRETVLGLIGTEHRREF